MTAPPRRSQASCRLELCGRDPVAAFAAPGEMHLPLSRCELGQVTGLTLETVSRQMRTLEKVGVIALPLPTHVRVLDACALNTMTGTAPARRAA